jgi:helix-turn-helix protein
MFLSRRIAIMSFAAIDWALRQGLSGPRHSVLLALANRADEATGNCWPSLNKIAADAGCCVRAARRAIRQLESIGRIWTEHLIGRRSNYWVLHGAPDAPKIAPTPWVPPPTDSPQLELPLGLTPARGAAPPRHEEPPNLHLQPPKDSRTELRSERAAPLDAARDSVQHTFSKEQQAAAPSPEAPPAPPAATSPAGPTAPPAVALASPDPTTRVLPTARSAVWGEGVQTVWRLSGKSHDTCQRVVGKMVRNMRGDCAGVLALIREADLDQPIAPIDWLMGCSKFRGSSHGIVEQACADLEVLGELYERHTAAGGLDASSDEVRAALTADGNYFPSNPDKMKAALVLSNIAGSRPLPGSIEIHG